MAKETEYGGQETVNTQGIQPLQPEEEVGRNTGSISRLWFATDPADEGSAPDRNATPVYRKEY